MELKGNVLLTGGSGYLGRGVMRRARRENWDCKLTVYSRDEMKQELCRREYPEVRYVLGDVKDYDRLEAALAGHETVIHMAAVKFIPEAEFNVQECLDVNTLGSQRVIEAALRVGVQSVIGISTDKAVQPVNVYGATKFLMEREFGEAARRSDFAGFGTRFNCVRYGNVVGSTGSVIPLFLNQMRNEQRIKLTDPRMTRFWLSVDQAIDLILIALYEPMQNGSVVVPRPKAMTMKALAESIAGESPIDIIGQRPGEKMHESLMSYEESVRVNYRVGYYELMSPGNKGGVEPFTLASHTPDGWIEQDEMRQMIEDSFNV